MVSQKLPSMPHRCYTDLKNSAHNNAVTTKRSDRKAIP